MITALDVVPEGEMVERLQAKGMELSEEDRAHLAVQLRDPGLSGRELWRWGERLRALTRGLGISFWVNDRLDLALILEADGLHLGRRSMGVRDARTWSDLRISVSAHSVDEVIRAAGQGVDMVLLSPIFASPGKGKPLGVEALREAKGELGAMGSTAALGALGGIDLGNARECFEAGADCVAAIRADLGGLCNL